MNDVAKHPWLMQRGDTFYVRAAVPKDIVAAFGKPEVKRSLRTKDPKEARKRIVREAAEISAEFEACRECQQRIDGAQETPDLPCSKHVSKLPASTLKALCEAHYQRVIDDDFDWRAEIRAQAIEDDEGFRHGKYIAHPTFEWYLFNCGDLDRDQKLVLCFEEQLSAQIKRFETALSVADCSDYIEAARVALGVHRLADSPKNVRRLARKLMEAELAALEAIRTKDRSRYDEIVGSEANLRSEVQPAQSQSPSVDPGPSLGSLVDAFLEEEEASGLVEATLHKARSVLREFVEVSGDRAVRSYQRSHATEFKDCLLKAPAARNAKPYSGLSLPDAVALAVEHRSNGEDITTLHVDTINDKLLYLRKFFTWADGRFGDVSNPFDGQRIKRRRQRGKRTDRRLPFTLDELQRLFGSPIYKGCQSLKRWAKPGDVVPRESARFWVPLIALYSGMRLGEIIQLRTSDIKQDDDGIAYFDITTLLDEDDGEAAKSLKNANSVREVPIHANLFEFGFQDLVDKRRDERAPLAQVFTEKHLMMP